MNLSVGSPMLEACLLAVLSRGDAYGYGLTQELTAHLGTSESTLYPVLRRLQKEGCLSVYDQPFQGRNRRYYTLTDVGAQRLKEYQEAWSDYRKKVEDLLLTDGKEGPDDQAPIFEHLRLLPRRKTSGA